jgi:hypothetical protein
MSWLKVDDGFEDHPKVEPLSHEAHRLWVRAACWCRKPANAHTNGFVPEGLLEVIAKRMAPLRKLKVYANELVNARAGGTKEHGLWEPREGGWQFHDWQDYQPADDPQKVSGARSEAGRKGAAARWQKRSEPPRGPLATDANANGKPDGKPIANASFANGKTIAKNAPDPLPIPIQGSNPPTQDLKAGAGDGDDAGGGDGSKRKIPCPGDLDLTEDQKTSLEMSPGIPRWATEIMVGEERSALLPKTNLRMPLESWHVYLSKIICARWSDQSKRPLKTEANGAPKSSGWHASELGIAVGDDD